VYAPRPDATPKAELDALANVYRFILDCKAERSSAPTMLRITGGL
jgi:hypothetical protein